MRQLLNFGTTNPHQPGAALGRQLVEWHRAMQAEIGQYRQASRLNTYGTTPAEHLQAALNQIWSARPSLETPSQTINLVTAPTPRLPDEMFDFIHLKEMNVLDCGLRELSPRIGNLSALESLRLTHNPHLAALPAEVGDLGQLKHLALVDSSVQALPSMERLTNLERLAVWHSPLASLPADVSAARRLEALSLSRTALSTLPEGIGELRRLKELVLAENPQLATVPASIGRLANLERLDLSKCPNIRSLPTSIGQLAALKKLDLTNCTGLTELPESIGNLPNLQRINLSGCTNLRSVPASLRQPRPGRQVTLPPHLRLPADARVTGPGPNASPARSPSPIRLNQPAAGAGRVATQRLARANPPALARPNLQADMRDALGPLQGSMEAAHYERLQSDMAKLPADWQQKLAPHIDAPHIQKMARWLADQARSIWHAANIDARLGEIIHAITAPTPEAASLRNSVSGQFLTTQHITLDDVEGAFFAHQVRSGAMDADAIMKKGMQLAEWTEPTLAGKQNYLRAWQALHASAIEHDPVGVILNAHFERETDKLNDQLFQTAGPQAAVMTDAEFRNALNTINDRRTDRLKALHKRVANQWLHPECAQIVAASAARALPVIKRALEADANALLDAIAADPVIQQSEKAMKDARASHTRLRDPVARAAAYAEVDTGYVATLTGLYQALSEAALKNVADASASTSR
ncbi:leucine-rich repeat domain-containing protein [Ralstonia sp. 25C]|uniref:leucine-rich repeat domain-containing protein n=1 Tax=Ralstonia sp. 25C TaxID=3447363 RepID=UPI003F7508C6